MLVANGFTVNALTISEDHEWFQRFSGRGDSDPRIKAITTNPIAILDRGGSRHRVTSRERLFESFGREQFDSILSSPLTQSEVAALGIREELNATVDEWEEDNDDDADEEDA